jgi:hypothetical protein
MDQKNLTIGVLSTTAAIMLVGLVLVTCRTSPVIAAGMTEHGGDYIMTVGASPQADEQFLYVIDVPLQKMVVYRFVYDSTRAAVDMLQGIDLGEFREKAGQPAGRRQP